MKILLVDDDTLLSAALAKILINNHYTIDLAGNGQAGLDLAMSAEYDLILLDWIIPQLDGVSLCRRLRSQGYCTPILFLTAKNSDADVIVGLDAGADDYMIKSHNPEVLLAKIRALLRRGEASTALASKNDLSQLTWGNLCLDQISGKVTCDRQIITLTATEYKLLELFLQHPNRIFTRSMILDMLWGFDDAPIENAVTTHIKDLRKKLKTGGVTAEILETVYGMGYRLKSLPDSPHGTIAEKSSQQTQKEKDLALSINQILVRFSNSFAEQVAVLDRAKTALLVSNLPDDLRQTAQDQAHKLAGSMGTFGYPEGSQLALDIEQLLIQDRLLSDDEVCQFSQLVSALQQELTKSPVNYTLGVGDET